MAGYRVKVQTVQFALNASMQMRSLHDRQQFHDPDGLSQALGISSAAWPLFGQVWPSAWRLAAHMQLRPLVDGERMLELGCGLALPSLVAHRRGADITASDRHPLTARFLLQNVRLNGLQPLKYRHGDWSQPLTGARTLGPIGAMEVQGRFDLLIGSDVLYERDDGGLLSAYIDRHALAAAEVLIVDPDRGNRSAFSRRMAVLGFTLNESRMDARLPGEQLAFKGRLLAYTRRCGREEYNCAPAV